MNDNGTEPRRQCSHTSDEGSPCGAPPQLVRESAVGGLWCLAHDPDPAVAKDRDEARRRGGEATGRKNARRPQPLDLRLSDDPTESEIMRANVIVTRANADGLISDGRTNALRQCLKELREAREAAALERLENEARRAGRLT